MYHDVSSSGYHYLQDKLVEDKVDFSGIGPIYLRSACERNYRRKSKEEKQQHNALILSSPGQMNTEQSEQNIQLLKCWRIPYQYGCFICDALLSNNSVLVPVDARLDLFTEHDVYLCDKQMCCAHHLVGSRLAPHQTIDITHYESASLPPSEVTQLVINLKDEMKRRRTQPHLRLSNPILDEEELKD